MGGVRSKGKQFDSTLKPGGSCDENEANRIHRSSLFDQARVLCNQISLEKKRHPVSPDGYVKLGIPTHSHVCTYFSALLVVLRF